ncbi:Uncharacterized protein APZ42_031188 [Daphnia magna]|uniref:Uncharacterized protein n=1 Tax=Daphnia magna TaxID=35525 RepID=A0A164N2Q7_9CRUS|nr:Uncharacterized protein APZ42_031188 [Daphnia magna]
MFIRLFTRTTQRLTIVNVSIRFHLTARISLLRPERSCLNLENSITKALTLPLTLALYVDIRSHFLSALVGIKQSTVSFKYRSQHFFF